MRLKSYIRVLSPALGIAAFLPDTALAYIGPGAGLSAIGTLIAVVGAVLLAIAGFVWYPVKRLLKSRRKPAAETARKAPTSDGT